MCGHVLEVSSMNKHLLNELNASDVLCAFERALWTYEGGLDS